MLRKAAGARRPDFLLILTDFDMTFNDFLLFGWFLMIFSIYDTKCFLNYAVNSMAVSILYLSL